LTDLWLAIGHTHKEAPICESRNAASPGIELVSSSERKGASTGESNASESEENGPTDGIVVESKSASGIQRMPKCEERGVPSSI
jgi:hypothetical protein